MGDIAHNENIVYKGNIAYGDRLLCRDIDIRLSAGDCVLLCGANGSGKSTLLRTLAAVSPSKTALIPTGIPKVRGFSLREFVGMGCGRLDAVSDSLSLLGIGELCNRDISTLSDGEFQKACIAIALCSDKEFLLMDEPTAFLDPENRETVLSCLEKLASSGRGIVFSSHDIDASLRHSNRVWAIGRDITLHCGGGDNMSSVCNDVFSKN